MIAFLPIARYRVDYQVASGRPFSSFERLLLRAIHERHDSVTELARIFALHNRVIIEGLVTLMQAGWVSLNAQEDRFVLSPSGAAACEGKELPPTIAVSDRWSTIIVEKVAGQVARNNQVEFHLRKKLEKVWSEGVPLGRGDVSNIIDPALISPLLSHQPTEWIRWIGPITVISDNAAFALIDVNTTTEHITGIPKSWETLLIAGCVDRVRAREHKLAADGAEISDRELRRMVRREVIAEQKDDGSEIGPTWLPLTLDQDDVLRSSDDHLAAFHNLASSAATYMAIACPRLSQAPAAAMLGTLKQALDRGIVVNVFLGRLPRKEDADGWAGFELLKKLEYDNAREAHGGRFVVGVLGTECSTSIALADTNESAAAILGNYNWCSPSPNHDERLSLRLSDPWVVARLCEVLAGFSSADEKLRLGAGLVRLKKAAGELRQMERADEQAIPVGRPLRAQAQLLLDRDHADAIYSLASQASKSISIFTEDLAVFSRSGWLRLVMTAVETLGSAVRIVYSSPKSVDLDGIPFLESVIKNGASLVRRDGISATVFVVDNNRAIITTLASDAATARRAYSARIGLAVKNANEEIGYLNLFGDKSGDSV